MIIVEVIGSLHGYKLGERVGFVSESRVRELTTCRPPAVKVIETVADTVPPPQQISEHLQKRFNLNPDGSPRQAAPVASAASIAPVAVAAAAAPKADALELLTVPAKAPAKASKTPQAK